MTCWRLLLVSVCVLQIKLCDITVTASATDQLPSCRPGAFIQNEQCATCPSHHYCKGGRETPSLCPSNSFDYYTGNTTNIDDCACDAGFFRTDDADTIAIALSQHGLSLQDSRMLWCVLCPVGYLCDAPRRRASSQTLVTKCPALGTTRAPGASLLSDCTCMPGSYNDSIRTNLTFPCVTCLENHYCVGQNIRPSSCAPKTISSAGATSSAGCICLPPLVMLPTFNADFRYDCVVQSAAAFTDSGMTVGMQHESYDMFGMEANVLYSTYAAAPAAPCVLIETGKNMYFSRFGMI